MSKTKIFLAILFLSSAVILGDKGYKDYSNKKELNITVPQLQLPASPLATEPVRTKTIKSFKIDPSQVLTFDVVVTNASVEEAIHQLDIMTSTNSTVYLFINSPGGSVFAGNKLIAYIEASKATINTVCIGICASMAAHIHQTGKARMVFDNAILMFHPASGGADGQIENMISLLTSVKSMVDKLDAKIAKRSGMSFGEFKARVAFEYWVLSDEAYDKHFADSIVYISTTDPENSTGTRVSDLLAPSLFEYTQQPNIKKEIKLPDFFL